MTSETDRLRADIEETRADVGQDVDALTEKVDPRRIADRRLQSIRDTASDVRDQVMGTASDATNEVSSTAARAVRKPLQRARGNPVASGLIVFGIGWLLGSVLPMSDRERDVAGQAMEAAEPVREEMMDVAGQIKEGMREPVQEAAEQLKDSAAQATTAVKETASQAVDNKERPYPVSGVQTTDAEAKPLEDSPRGWWLILRHSLQECSRDQVTLVGAGVAFYAFLSLFPAIAAVVMIYGLATDPSQVTQQLDAAAGMLPPAARDLVHQQLIAVASAPQQQLGVGLVIALALALWTASGAMDNLIKALDVAYEKDDHRGFVRRRALAIALTIGALIVLALVAALASIRASTFGLPPLPAAQTWVFEIVRWVLLVAVLVGSLVVLYRVAPDTHEPHARWVTAGTIAALLLWLLATIGFSIYTTSFGNYAKTYGTFAGVAVLLLWLWLTAVAVLLGAELNAESELPGR